MEKRFAVSKKALLSMMPLFILAAPLMTWARLVVSELYRDPPGTEGALGGGASHEFVEVTNVGPDTITTDALFITNGLEADSIIPENAVIPGHENCRYATRFITPGLSALILDPDYREAVIADSTCRFQIPDSTLMLRCGDGEFGSAGLAADHGVLIYRGSKTRIDTVLCSAADPEASLQSPAGGKITLSNPENIEGISLVAIGSTTEHPFFDYCPGTLSPGRFEPYRDSWIAEYHLGRFDRLTGAVSCTVLVLSTRVPADAQVPWLLTRKENGKETTVRSGTMTLADFLGAAVITVPADSAEHYFTLQIDSRPSWSIDLSEVWLPEGAIRITEIFPKAVSGEPEWFEVENRSSMTVNLKNWRFGNGNDTVTITETSFSLKPGAFTVITKDAATLTVRYRALQSAITPRHWVALDNTRDTVKLFDAQGTLRETVCYDDTWFTEWPYLSLERNGGSEGCSDASWSVALRASPGMPNEALYWRAIDEPSLDIGPVPFTPDGDGNNDLLAIRLKLPANADATVTVFGFDGREVRRFTGPPREIVYWDGRGTSGVTPPGPFFVVAEIKRNGTTRNLRKKGILWRR